MKPCATRVASRWIRASLDQAGVGASLDRTAIDIAKKLGGRVTDHPNTSTTTDWTNTGAQISVPRFGRSAILYLTASYIEAGPHSPYPNDSAVALRMFASGFDDKARWSRLMRAAKSADMWGGRNADSSWAKPDFAIKMLDRYVTDLIVGALT